ncbi:hypothetical protein HBI18_042470 [Parastagonospora nodorum]|nr:hypothetical protein HBI18_042470 [Parastagonospora nodorum]
MESVSNHGCCPTCNCLGYCAAQSQSPSFKILSKRSFHDFQTSSLQGCAFCDVALQSCMLFQFVEAETQVEVLIYAQSPTELHSRANRDAQDIVEIYPSSSGTGNVFRNTGTDVQRQVTLEASIEFMKEHFHSCITEHENCLGSQDAVLPRRLLDISGPRYRLVEQPTGTRGRFAALSYSWGDKGFKMTTSHKYEELQAGMDHNMLPTVFQDAAAMAQSFGIQYLWIDTLCIIQDCEEDWEEQAAKMCEIFEGAAITIAASASQNPAQTLFAKRHPKYQEIELYSDPKGKLADIEFKARRKINCGIHDKPGWSTETDPLDTRAWALQERLLATRLIAFTGAELQWVCKTLKACECRRSTYPSQPLFATKTTSSDAETIRAHARSWSDIVEEYSTRKLSFPKDKLPALNGLASKFAHVTGFEYFAGSWVETLLYDLAWQSEVEISGEWLGPSFSWASAPGPVNYRYAYHSYPGSRILHPEVLQHTAELSVRGPTVEARLRSSSTDRTICIDEMVYAPNINQMTVCEFVIDAYAPHRATQELDTTATFDDPITLLALYSIHHKNHLYQVFLILARSRKGTGEYERIGVGTGKLYCGRGFEDPIPSEAAIVKPFEWLEFDFGKKGSEGGEVVEQTLCIR